MDIFIIYHICYILSFARKLWKLHQRQQSKFVKNVSYSEFWSDCNLTQAYTLPKWLHCGLRFSRKMIWSDDKTVIYTCTPTLMYYRKACEYVSIHEANWKAVSGNIYDQLAEMWHCPLTFVLYHSSVYYCIVCNTRTTKIDETFIKIQLAGGHHLAYSWNVPDVPYMQNTC